MPSRTKTPVHRFRAEGVSTEAPCLAALMLLGRPRLTVYLPIRALIAAQNCAPQGSNCRGSFRMFAFSSPLGYTGVMRAGSAPWPTIPRQPARHLGNVEDQESRRKR